DRNDAGACRADWTREAKRDTDARVGLVERKERLARERRRTLRRERARWRDGVLLVAGVDEVGMGPLAGPVVAAAVVLPRRVRIDGIRDSKLLTSRARERLAAEIRSAAIGVGIGVAEVLE